MARVPQWTAQGAATKVILARVDGALEVADIAALTGVTTDEVEAALAPFVDAGVMRWEASPAAATSRLTADEQRAIHELYEKLANIDHYALLGVAATADAKAIKRAYFGQAKLFHPDRLFRRDVGALKLKIEAIFSALTNAQETLLDPYRRADYDEYLREVLRARITRKKAEQLEVERDWEGAADAWARVAAQLPADPYVLHRYATALLRARSNLDGAVALSIRATEIDPTRPEYRLTLASLYLATGRDRGALSQLEIAATLDPERVEIAAMLAGVTERVARKGV